MRLYVMPMKQCCRGHVRVALRGNSICIFILLFCNQRECQDPNDTSQREQSHVFVFQRVSYIARSADDS